MTPIPELLAIVPALLATAGIVQAVAGYSAAKGFRVRLDETPAGNRVAMTILKPLCGDEPLLETALASLCEIDYPAYQIVFGVQDPADPALAVVERLRARYPDCDIDVVVDPRQHGENRKVGNLINMLALARHDVLVIGDSDVHVTPDYLDRIADSFADPAVGLVTTLYTGLPADHSLAATLGAAGITYGFLPGALMARKLGRQDTLGATMAIRRPTLAAIGGLHALVPHIADDHVLGRLVQEHGYQVALAATVTATTVPEQRFAPLFQHELRWSRTVLSLVPFEFTLSAMQFPLFWALFAVGLSGFEDWAVGVFLAAWVARAVAALGIDRALNLSRSGLAAPPPVWLLPLRDTLSIAVWLASYASDQVTWRGRVLHTGRSQSQDEIAYTPPNNAPAASAG